MNNEAPSRWPRTLAEVAAFSQSLEDFGRYLREWEHSISRKGVHSRPGLRKALADEPIVLENKYTGGDIADAYLAALAEWLVRKHALKEIDWPKDPNRYTEQAWWANGFQASLLASTPASFRTRNLFTIPHDPFKSRRGRPPVTEEQKREKQRVRQKRYRDHTRELLQIARQLGHS
jgi:hypothetical protein|tara:strand:+ start:263 stop:790 length:528 start_codon:yes stop_codon:yes gene_type:complete